MKKRAATLRERIRQLLEKKEKEKCEPELSCRKPDYDQSPVNKITVRTIEGFWGQQ